MAVLSKILDVLKGAAAGKEMPAPAINIEFEIRVGDFSDEETVSIDVPELDCIGRSFGIRYSDAKGNESQRRITVKSLTPQASDLLVKAYCHERRAARAFKASRIQEIVDLETGEVETDALAFFAKYLSDDPAYDALRNCGPELQVLAFFARCDGEFEETEKDAIVDFVMERAAADIDAEAIESHVVGLHPDSDSLYRGLELTAEKGEPAIRNLVKWIKRVVEADGVTASEEIAWLEEAEELLS